MAKDPRHHVGGGVPDDDVDDLADGRGGPRANKDERPNDLGGTTCLTLLDLSNTASSVVCVALRVDVKDRHELQQYLTPLKNTCEARRKQGVWHA